MLRRTLVYVLKPLALLMGLFALSRLIFIVYHNDKFEGIPISERLGVLIEALHLDLSVSAYIMVLPIVALLFQVLIPFGFLRIFQAVYYPLVFFFLALISTADLPLYQEWGTKLHYKALIYLAHPNEVIASAASSPILILLPIMGLQFGVAWWAYRKWAHTEFQNPDQKLRTVFPQTLLLLFLAGMLAIAMRGGVQEIPINQSAAYYSNHHILNHTAVNSSWSMIHSVRENWKNLDKNPYEIMDRAEATRIVEGLHQAGSQPGRIILDHAKPNLLLIILEGWTADVVEKLGGKTGVTPYFGLLADEGLLFTQTYASGMRSDKGIIALLSGFPSMPNNSITTQPEKCEKLPSLSKSLKPLGYSSGFYFGGDLRYGNIKSYLLSQQFDLLVDEADFEPNLRQASLGVPDQYVFDRLLTDLAETKQPFFRVLFTLSSHEPFDIPSDWQGHFEGNNEAARYLDAVRYADHCLGNFFEAARKTDWYKNTLFIIVSDHSHHWPLNHRIYSPERHRIPMLMFGEPLLDSLMGTQPEVLANQTDLPATLLAQLGLPGSPYRWSRDLFRNGTASFGFYTFIEGYGFIKGESSFSWENRFQHFTHKEADTTIIKQGQAYMQEVFQDYLEY